MAYSVSIILPTINEEENLKLLIPDLIENLDGIDYSIIVAMMGHLITLKNMLNL